MRNPPLRHIVGSYRKEDGTKVRSYTRGSFGTRLKGGMPRATNPLYLDSGSTKRIGGSRPMPGDVIKPINSEDSLIPPTSYGIIEGVIGEYRPDYMVTFNPSPAPWWDRGIVNSSGGPAFFIKASNMKPAGWKKQPFQYFPGGFMGAGLAKYKTINVRVWKVDGSKW